MASTNRVYFVGNNTTQYENLPAKEIKRQHQHKSAEYVVAMKRKKVNHGEIESARPNSYRCLLRAGHFSTPDCCSAAL